ncbi:WD40 repeat domain-containing protein [Halomonas sp. C05BenzN]|uniref:WD40 repeat domain-containing protein n=1 Tax=Halomonas sp. C05BenzN TaxID=3411041 RepID=UPI003B93D025
MSRRASTGIRRGAWGLALCLGLLAGVGFGSTGGSVAPDWADADLLHEIEIETETREERVERLALSPEGARVAIAVRGRLELREVATGEMIHRLDGHLSPEIDAVLPVTGLAFSPDGASLISASWNPGVVADASLKHWDLATGNLLQALAGDQGCREVAFTADGASVWAACGRDVQRLELATGRVVERAGRFPADVTQGMDAEAVADALPMPRQGPADALALSADGKRLAWAGKPPTYPHPVVRVWHVGEGASADDTYQALELPEVSTTTDPVAQARELYGLEEFTPVTSETVSHWVRDDGDLQVMLRLDDLKDDAVRALRYRLRFAPAGEGQWALVQAGRKQQCRRGPTGPDEWTTQLCH